MTIPEERFRALRWGAELLEAMQQDEAVPQDLRERAGLTLKSYPGQQDLREAIGRGELGIRATWAEAIEKAADLFMSLQVSSCGSAELRRHLLFTLRHHPSSHEAADRKRLYMQVPLSSWLQPDR